MNVCVNETGKKKLLDGCSIVKRIDKNSIFMIFFSRDIQMSFKSALNTFDMTKCVAEV